MSSHIKRILVFSLLTIHLVVVTINTLVNHQQSVVMHHLVVKLVLLLLDELVVYVVQHKRKTINSIIRFSLYTYTQENLLVVVIVLYTYKDHQE
jgi:hypothetical protein